MQPQETSSPGVGKLLEAWLALTGRLLVSLSAKVKDLTDKTPDLIKDRICDLDWRPAAEPAAAAAEEPPLPPLIPAQFAAALQSQVEDVLHRVAAVLNEDPYGCCEELTTERVRALFQELEQQALAQAFELRLAAAESSRAAPSSGHGDWARKYRRMHAEERSGLERTAAVNRKS